MTRKYFIGNIIPRYINLLIQSRFFIWEERPGSGGTSTATSKSGQHNRMEHGHGEGPRTQPTQCPTHLLGLLEKQPGPPSPPL